MMSDHATWTAGATAGMRQIDQAPVSVGSSGAVPARAPAVHGLRSAP